LPYGEQGKQYAITVTADINCNGNKETKTFTFNPPQNNLRGYPGPIFSVNVQKGYFNQGSYPPGDYVVVRMGQNGSAVYGVPGPYVNTRYCPGNNFPQVENLTIISIQEV
jgi:hypothetical protein